jgi:4-aminobutyrate aminotransferase
MKRRAAAVPRGVANAFEVFPERAENAEIWDADGKRYVDFAGGIAVLNVGHQHPRVKAAVAAQMEKYSHPCFQVTPYEPYVALAERLNALAPGDFAKKTLFLSTGAEAVENAVKIARAHTRRPGVVAFGGAFHGRTMYTLALTGKTAPYKTGFDPLPGHVYHLPFPSEYHGVSTEDSLTALTRIFQFDVAPERVAAILIEPVQGEGGFYQAPTALLRKLREVCDEHGILLIADEIQSGVARTGRFFAIEHSGVVPDLITVAKSLAGGLPLSGVIGRADVMDAPGPGGLGGTFGGNAVACAAALAVLDVIRDENLLERATQMGARIAAHGARMQRDERFACIGEVRHLGAMCAIELVTDRATRAPAAELASEASRRALANGLVILRCGIYGNVLRVLVPLTAPDDIVDEGLSILEKSLAEAVDAS